MTNKLVVTEADMLTIPRFTLEGVVDFIAANKGAVINTHKEGRNVVLTADVVDLEKLVADEKARKLRAEELRDIHKIVAVMAPAGGPRTNDFQSVCVLDIQDYTAWYFTNGGDLRVEYREYDGNESDFFIPNAIWGAPDRVKAAVDFMEAFTKEHMQRQKIAERNRIDAQIAEVKRSLRELEARREAVDND